MFRSYSTIKCVLKGGPKDGEEHDLACLDDQGHVPCNTKEWFETSTCPTCGKAEEYFLKYRIKWTDSPEFEKDNQGRAVMYFEGNMTRGGTPNRNVDENGKWKER